VEKIYYKNNWLSSLLDIFYDRILLTFAIKFLKLLVVVLTLQKYDCTVFATNYNLFATSTETTRVHLTAGRIATPHSFALDVPDLELAIIADSAEDLLARMNSHAPELPLRVTLHHITHRRGLLINLEHLTPLRAN